MMEVVMRGQVLNTPSVQWPRLLPNLNLTLILLHRKIDI